MRKIGIKELKNNLSKELKELPFIVTSRGEDVAEVRVIGEVATSNEVATKKDDEVATFSNVIKTKEDVAKKIEIVGGYEVPKPFKMPHYFGGKQK